MDFFSTLSSTASDLYNSLEPSISTGLESLSQTASSAYSALEPTLSSGYDLGKDVMGGIGNVYETGRQYVSDVARVQQLESEASQGVSRLMRGDFGGAYESMKATVAAPFARHGVSKGAESLALTTTPYIQAARGVNNLVKLYGESGLTEHFARKKKEKERIKEANEDVEFEFGRSRRKKKREHATIIAALKDEGASKEEIEDENEKQKEEWVMFEREYKRAKKKASEGEKIDFDVVKTLFGDGDIDEIQNKIQKKLKGIKGAREKDKGIVDEVYETGFNVLKDLAKNEMQHQLGKVGDVGNGVNGFGSSLTKNIWDKRKEMFKPPVPKVENIIPQPP